MEIDNIDKKIIYELDLNSRQSYKELGKKIRLNKNTVQYRIKRLEKNKIIKNYYTFIDTIKLVYITFRILIKFKNIPSQKEKEIIQYLKESNEIGWLVSIEGSWDLTSLIWVKDHYEFEEFWNNFRNKFGEYILKKRISIFTKLNFYTRPYLIDKKKDTINPVVQYHKNENKKKIDFDNKDIEILKLLAKNSRIELVKISQKLEMTINSVKYRMKKMEKNGIINAYKPMLDIKKLGYKYYKFQGNLKNKNEEVWNKVKTFCHTHPNILSLNEYINGDDLEINIQVKDKEELRKIIETIKIEFQDELIEFEISEFYKEHKFVFFPIK